MSTKIYYGYKIFVNQEDLMPFLVDFKNRIQDDVNTGIFTLSQILFAYERIYELFGIANEEYAKIRKQLQRIYTDTIKWSIAIIPRKDYFLAILYFPNSAWIDEFEKDKRVEYYGYWNNSDKPEDITEEEWEQRRKEWECLSYGVPVCREALVYEPFTSWEFPTIKGIINGIHSPEYLRDIVAKDLYDRFAVNISFHRFKWKIPLVTKELLLDNTLFLNNKYINLGGKSET